MRAVPLSCIYLNGVTTAVKRIVCIAVKTDKKEMVDESNKKGIRISTVKHIANRR